MYKYFLVLFVIFPAIVLKAQESSMSASEIAAFKEKVVLVAKTTQTIKADFVQYKHLNFLSNDVETSGNMAFKAPNLVKWEYTDPYQYSVIFKENELLINDGGTKSNVNIGSSKLFKKLNQLIVNSVKGNMFADADFEVTYFKSPDFFKVIFKPKNSKIARFIATFELLFDKEEMQVFEIKMIEPSADFTRIVFSNRVLNSAINNEVFNN